MNSLFHWDSRTNLLTPTYTRADFLSLGLPRSGFLKWVLAIFVFFLFSLLAFNSAFAQLDAYKECLSDKTFLTQNPGVNQQQFCEQYKGSTSTPTVVNGQTDPVPMEYFPIGSSINNTGSPTPSNGKGQGLGSSASSSSGIETASSSYYDSEDGSYHPGSASDDVGTSGCTSSIQKVQSACNGQVLQQIVPQMQKFAALSSANGTIQGQCRAAANLNLVAGSASMELVTSCMTAKRSCQAACSSNLADRSLSSACNGYSYQMSTAAFSAAYSFLSSRQASQCEQLTSQKSCTGANLLTDPNCMTQYCSGPMASSDPMCTSAYCSVPSHASNPACRTNTSALNCNQSAMANSAVCACASNPNSAACLQAQNSVGGASSSGTLNSGSESNSGDFTSADSSHSGNLQEEPTLPSAHPDPVGSDKLMAIVPIPAGSNASSFGAASSNGFQGSSHIPNGDWNSHAADKEIGLAIQAAGALDGYATGAGLANESGADRIYSTDGLKHSNGIYAGLNGMSLTGLIGNSGFSSRSPASQTNSLYQNGITPANGLSNWEKVTRKLNEKANAQELLP